MDFELVLQEIKFKTSRSSGAGGQHVNKVESRVTLLWDFEHSLALTEEEKSLIRFKQKNRLQADGFLYLDVQTSRSQYSNKKIAIERLKSLIDESTLKNKHRIKTKIPRTVVLSRLDRKSKISEKKHNRKWKYDQ